MKDKLTKKEIKKLTCFRCGKPIEEELYVRTLSNETTHLYCQINGIKPIQEVIKNERR